MKFWGSIFAIIMAGCFYLYFGHFQYQDHLTFCRESKPLATTLTAGIFEGKRRADLISVVEQKNYKDAQRFFYSDAIDDALEEFDLIALGKSTRETVEATFSSRFENCESYFNFFAMGSWEP